MLNLSIAGTLGGDAELRAAGTSQVLVFSVAVNGWNSRDREKTTTWVRCQIWGQRGEKLASMLTKGTRVAMSGELELQTYTDRNGERRTTLQLTGQSVTLQGGGQGRDDSQAHAARGRADQQRQPDDDEIPF